MKKLFKIFIALGLCLFVITLSACGQETIEKKIENAESLISSGELQYPLTDDFFRYNIYSTYVSITQCLSTETHIEIPASINNLPVLGIEEDAFLNNKNIKTIKINADLHYIKASAFEGCTSLKSIELPSSLTEIGKSAFEDCVSLRQIIIPANITTIPDNVFNGCIFLEKAIIEESNNKSTKSIGSNAFANCENLSFVWIPDDVTKIQKNSFKNTPTNLKIYGYPASAASDYCATYLINFAILDRTNFDNIAILSNKIEVPQYLSVGESISSNTWKVTLKDYKEYSSIGDFKPAEGNVFLMINFNVTNLKTSDEFFNFLNLKAVVSGYDKTPTLLNTSVINSTNLLTGLVGPKQTINGYMLYEVNKNWIYTYIDFSDIEGFNKLGNYETRLAIYPEENALSY